MKSRDGILNSKRRFCAKLLARGRLIKRRPRGGPAIKRVSKRTWRIASFLKLPSFLSNLPSSSICSIWLERLQHRQPPVSSSPKKSSFVTLAAKPRSRSATSATTLRRGSCRATAKPKTRSVNRLFATTSCAKHRWTVRSSLNSVAKRKLKPPCRRCSSSWRSRRTASLARCLTTAGRISSTSVTTLVRCARSACSGTASAGTSMRAPSRVRSGGTMAARCSLAILFSDPRKLRLRRKPDPLSLGPFDPQSLVAVQLGIGGQFFYIKIFSDILSIEIMCYMAVMASMSWS